MSQTFTRGRADTLTLSTVLARGGMILIAALFISGLSGVLSDGRPVPTAVAAPVPGGSTDPVVEGLRIELASAKGALAVEQLKNRRAEAVLGYSAQYRIPADLAASIYDHAVTEGIDPAIAFRLVKVESAFRANVRSRARAIGYTQLKLGTARHYEPWITERDLRTRDVNLRIGFRFLRDLMRQYGGDVNLALVAYNRGPARVNEYLASGSNPDNGYGRKVLGNRHPATRTRVQAPAPAPRTPLGSE